MADYDFNMIKPVEGLQNVTRLNAARRREEKRRQRQFNGQDNKQDSSDKDDSQLNIDITGVEQDVSSKESTGKDINQGSEDAGIDFCA